MKRILSLVTMLTLFAARLNAQSSNATNSVAPFQTNIVAATADVTKFNITLGGGGLIVPKTGAAEESFSFSLTANPFISCRPLWIGIAQGAAWTPIAAGSTDFDADWNWTVTDKFCVLTGWSAGTVYSNEGPPSYRTGPEVLTQYYVSDTAFIYAQGNYDLQSRGNCGLRWSIGIGIEF